MRSLIFHSAIVLLLLNGPCFGAVSTGALEKTGTGKNDSVQMTPSQCTKFIRGLTKQVSALEMQLNDCIATTKPPANKCEAIRFRLYSAAQKLAVTRGCSSAQEPGSSTFSDLNIGSDKSTVIGLKNRKSGTISKPSSFKMPSMANSTLPAEESVAPSTAKKSRWDRFKSRVGAVKDSLVDIGKGVVGDVVGGVKDVATGLVKDLGSAGKNLLQGNFKDAAKDAGGAVVNAVVRTGGGVVDSLAKVALGGVDIVDSALLGKSLPRKLTTEERTLLDSVYKGSVNLDDVRIRTDSSSHLFMPAHAIGNTIYLKNPGPLYNANGTLTWDGQTLVHETGHVWQSQQGGGDYLHKALFANVKAAITEGDRNNAYEWKSLAAKDVPFEDLNPEQQATVIDNLAADELRPAGNKWLTPAETEYARKAMELVRSGQGAP